MEIIAPPVRVHPGPYSPESRAVWGICRAGITSVALVVTVRQLEKAFPHRGEAHGGGVFTDP